jgi:hypothetical protein
VPPPPLRYADKAHVDHILGDVVPPALECGDRRFENAAAIVSNRQYVLDAENLRFKDSSCPSDARIQSVPRIVASCVVVQIRMSLTRRASQSDDDLTNPPAKSLLASSQRGIECTIEELLDPLALDQRTGVRFEDRCRCRLAFDGEADAELGRELLGGEQQPDSQTAATRKQIEEPPRRVAGGEMRTVATPDDRLISVAARTDQASPLSEVPDAGAGA